jgi:hypothetical protein
MDTGDTGIKRYPLFMCDLKDGKSIESFQLINEGCLPEFTHISHSLGESKTYVV